MNTPILLFNTSTIDAQAMTSNIIPDFLDISDATRFCVHVFWTGSPVGNIIIEAGNETTTPVTLDTHAAGGTSGNYLYNYDGAGFIKLRVKYTFTSGSGTLNVKVSAKG